MTSVETSSGTDTEKYDRQLRLWGEDGQAKLEKTHICLLNGTATGTETLKNLVLPGIGSFTVIDGKKVSASDLGNNFFVEKSDIGESRAKVVCEWLRELNDRVKGYSMEEDPVHLIENNINVFKDYNLVVANRIPEQPLLVLAQFLWENKIPLVVVNSYGFIGYLRIVVPEHQIIESKPDTPLDDLRIFTPFKELEEHAHKIELEGLNSQQHSHIPYVVLLIKFLKEWRESHNGKMPETRQEKEEFKQFFTSKSRSIHNEENFQEGVKNLLKSLQPARIPSDLDAILKDPKAVNITDQTDDFWILVSALKGFVETHGTVPLLGNVPDMHSDTTGFIQLQKIYQEKAIADLSDFTSRVDSIASRSLAEEFESPKVQTIVSELQQPDSSLVFYIVLRCIDRFYQTYNRYPGFNDEEIDSDITLLKSTLTSYLQEYSIPISLVKDDYIAELTRFGACELHNIASLMGGITSQEIIKLVTHQYVPLNNTFIFNGIDSTASPFNL
eukprot:gene5270-6561_t